MSSIQVCLRYGIRQPTAWTFMHKVRKAIESSKKYPMSTLVNVDEFVVGGAEEGMPDRSYNTVKTKAIITVKLSEKQKVKWVYIKSIENYSAWSLTTIFIEHNGGEIAIKLLRAGYTIPNYDPSKLAIYAIEGSGMSKQPIGFTYSMMDTAHKASQPASYIILTESALPVELIFFTASIDQCKTILEWATASELNNDNFKVQRSSNSYQWETIGIVNGNGNSNIRVDYQFDVNDMLNGINYYRLNQIDFYGAFEYSNIISLEYKSNVKVKIFPVPAQNTLNVNITKDNIQKVQLTIIDVSGRRVRTISNIDATNQIDLSHLRKVHISYKSIQIIVKYNLIRSLLLDKEIGFKTK